MERGERGAEPGRKALSRAGLQVRRAGRSAALRCAFVGGTAWTWGAAEI